MIRVLFLLASLLVTSTRAFDFPRPYDSEAGDASPMPPGEALKALKLPDGFAATLFAAEPQVQNPIAMSWDARGRMWVAENYTYAERSKRFDLSLRDRVVILEDKDWDGVAETRRVFTDDVQMLTSVEVGPGGVWLMCPPQLLFIPDANGDDIPDGPPQVMLDGFTVAQANYHNFANGLRMAQDGWLYGRCGHSCPGRLGTPGTPDHGRVPIKGGIWRFHPEKRIVEVLTHGTTNPWGHDWDANGELFFINTVTGHLWHLMHGAHLVDSAARLNPLIYEPLDTIADHYHYDRSGKWSDSRDGKANDFGGGHAHIGMMIYQGNQWPAQYRDKLFTLNMHGRRANVERLERQGSGYVGKHEPDFLISGDPWFRGLEVSTGPDGSGFVLDWSDTGECHEHNGVHRTSGRIYRISHGTPGKPETPFAWRKPWPKPDIHSADEHARALGVREMVQFSPIDTIVGPMPGARYPELAFDPAGMARTELSAFVRLNLASVLQRLPLEQRPSLATALLSHAEDAHDPFLPRMVWFGISPLATNNPMALVELSASCSWPTTLRWMARSLAPNPGVLDALLAVNASEPVLMGMLDAFKGHRKAPKPRGWDAIAAKSTASVVRDLGILFGDRRAMGDVRRVVLDEKADMIAREAALRTLMDARPPDLRELCERLLDVRSLNMTAVRGLALFSDPEIGVHLARNYRRFYPQERPAVIETLVSRPAFAKSLLEEVAAGRIPREDIAAFHARQIRSFKDLELSRRLTEVWGEMRETDADKKQVIAKLKSDLTPDVLAMANLSRGRQLYQACAACHVLYGEGAKVGPDLTGSGRSNLDYLLENIVDPSGVVSADFRMTTIDLKDGRVLTGIVAARDERVVTLRTQTGDVVLLHSDIEAQQMSSLSMMPEGLLQSLTQEQIRDLIAYLMHPVQVPLPVGK